MAGLCAALAAARRGAKTVLVQDRPVLGGNASSEVRMHICGAHGPNRRETGILEEIQLENLRYNAGSCWSVFDSLLWGIAAREPNLMLVMNAGVCSCTMDGALLRSVRAWQGTTQKWIEIEAPLFADCSGDAVLAPLSGAEFRIGREASAEFGESEAPAVADRCTMGNSILFQTMEFAGPVDFVPPPWAHDFSAPGERHWVENRLVDPTRTNMWWIEVGGADDSIRNAEMHRDELLRIAYGVWDWAKNHSPIREKLRNFGLEWVGALPGKRESRRYVGDHILVQGDVQSGGASFTDIVAYGGWKIDNHYPKGFYHDGPGTKYTDCPSPFAIPYRCLYSRNVPNLFCAGRDISCSHVAMSAARVMAPCALEGPAVGTAAANAARDGLDARGVGASRIAELQASLMDDDCFLPGLRREMRGPCAAAALSATGGEGVERLRDGMDRDWDDGPHAWSCAPGVAAEYRFEAEAPLSRARIVFDSDLNRREFDRAFGGNDGCSQGRYYRALGDKPRAVPASLVRAFRIESLGSGGTWKTEVLVENNHQRLVRLPLRCRTAAVRLVPLATWGAPVARTFAFEVC
ncbi:MAG: FAD-dependent oxidoreductase [Kiritimatiellae bacterium]|nr:FAD-dependent oxidoreductase [Kiritimatiellia bacterium]